MVEWNSMVLQTYHFVHNMGSKICLFNNIIYKCCFVDMIHKGSRGFIWEGGEIFRSARVNSSQGMILLIAYLTQLNGDEKRVIAVLNESDYFSNEFVTSQATAYVNFSDLTLTQAKDSTLNMGYYGLVYLPKETDVESRNKKKTRI